VKRLLMKFQEPLPPNAVVAADDDLLSN
jgi:hypothetical protein